MATTRTLMTIGIVIIVIAVVAAGVFVALGAKTGTVSVRVKDQPASWSHVNVTFSSVEVHQLSVSGTEWVPLSITTSTIDLVPLTDTDRPLASATVPVGTYDQVRFVVSSATGVMTNGTHATFSVPSGELTTDFSFNVTAGVTRP